MTEDDDSADALNARELADAAVHDQIVAAASEHFRHYGYAKTTVSDLAKAIGFSKAYIYKFFDSKQSIGEAICLERLGKISRQAELEVRGCRTAQDKLVRLFRTIVDGTKALLSADKRVFDMAAFSTQERWSSYQAYMDTLHVALRAIIAEGRETGEFERKTPLDETCRVILQAMQPFINPLMLKYSFDPAPDAPDEVISLVLRSLISSHRPVTN
jgi:AcrR family transcriptional regulator